MPTKEKVKNIVDVVTGVLNSGMAVTFFTSNFYNHIIDPQSPYSPEGAAYRGMIGLAMILKPGFKGGSYLGINAGITLLTGAVTLPSVTNAIESPTGENIGLAVFDSAITLWNAYGTIDSARDLYNKTKEGKKGSSSDESTTAQFSITDRLKDLGSKAIGFAKNKTTEYTPIIQRTANAFH
ncbi:hypothetical protein HN695_02540 [Candidatus Woesearchaeota archaeon]|jgi:hypothetical protein|nr:hypothetical protein [Candidatus Woesearchaeota archaeon]MBT5272964.1 hypothetical protein [Candidatus Woesearchaeota archaeon]MBT6041430.1 hypothetical protein [Candidatus Woesearchaeota archaeon]MBT6337313.1 hypothetical protein [Candidatus Woesearchaeota archaeon]MBT7927190.1 hypothetical protein [Candidatus Woesearchaeota archaeon]